MEIDIIEELKRLYQTKTDYQFAKKLNINRSQVNRWRKKGFHKSSKTVICELINKNRELEAQIKQYNSRQTVNKNIILDQHSDKKSRPNRRNR